jgi:FKBP-type peptidyl-prolyl cis-trans isomerase SlpA
VSDACSPCPRRTPSVSPTSTTCSASTANIFGEDIELQPGLVCGFNDASGGEVPGMVVAFDEHEVTVDFNHPLAGRTIVFDVLVHRVEAAELH